MVFAPGRNRNEGYKEEQIRWFRKAKVINSLARGLTNDRRAAFLQII